MPLKKWINRHLIWAIHIIVWAAIFMLPFIFNHNHEVDGPKHNDDFKYLDTVTNFLWMGLFYLNALLLLPRLLYTGKYVVYGITLVAAYVVIMLLHAALFTFMITGKSFHITPSVIHNLAPFFFTLVISTAYKIIYDKFTADANAVVLQKENLKTELSFLRSQISPHFLFNVLNNIVAMVRLKSDELEPTVIKLSTLLQYMLYESGDEKVLLKSEVESVRDFIDLQKLRFTPRLKLTTDINVKEDWHAIEPMLLIPFVENAFKHGNVFGEPPEILIALHVDGNTLYFHVRNKFVALDKAKDKTSGIGLINVKRRLELLYPGQHTLELTTDGGYYDVRLKLLLK